MAELERNRTARRFGVYSSRGFPIPALSRYVDTPASIMKKIGMSNENIFGGLPEPVGSIWANGCVSIATAQTARLIVMSFFFSDVFMCLMMMSRRLDCSTRIHWNGLETPNDQSTATRRTGRPDCNHDAHAGFAAACNQAK